MNGSQESDMNCYVFVNYVADLLLCYYVIIYMLLCCSDYVVNNPMLCHMWLIMLCYVVNHIMLCCKLWYAML